MKVGMLAGESSGDLLGAKLITALRRKFPDLTVEGIGGPHMQASGCQILFDMERLAVMGFIEPLLRLPDLIRLRKAIIQHFLAHPPDVFIGIDSPDFNLGIEVKLRQAGIKVVHYVSPSVWAWRQYRLKKIAQAVDLMLVLLPFEARFYEQHHVPVRYIGHPFAEQIPLMIDKVEARKTLGIEQEGLYVALLPGSRRQEIKQMAELYLNSASLALKQLPQLKFLITHSNENRSNEFKTIHQQSLIDLPLHSFIQQTRMVLAAADAVVVTSGTATLEAMLYKKPMIIAYRMSWLTYQIAKRVVRTPFIGLPNLLANQLLVPELIQEAAHSEAIAAHLVNYLTHPEKMASIANVFTALHEKLRLNSSELAAEAICDLFK